MNDQSTIDDVIEKLNQMRPTNPIHDWTDYAKMRDKFINEAIDVITNTKTVYVKDNVFDDIAEGRRKHFCFANDSMQVGDRIAFTVYNHQQRVYARITFEEIMNDLKIVSLELV